jgi:hypothetical protein
MANKKRVYKYGQCYKCPKCFTTYEVTLVYPIENRRMIKEFGRAGLTIMNVVTREETTVPAEALDSYEQEYTYCE